MMEKRKEEKKKRERKKNIRVKEKRLTETKCRPMVKGAKEGKEKGWTSMTMAFIFIIHPSHHPRSILPSLPPICRDAFLPPLHLLFCV